MIKISLMTWMATMVTLSTIEPSISSLQFLKKTLSKSSLKIIRWTRWCSRLNRLIKITMGMSQGMSLMIFWNCSIKVSLKVKTSLWLSRGLEAFKTKYWLITKPSNNGLRTLSRNFKNLKVKISKSLRMKVHKYKKALFKVK